MKKSILLVLLVAISSFSFAQKFKFEKITRDVRKEAKKYEKEGWKPFAGSMPISQQLNNTFNKENEMDEKNVPKWLFAEGESIGQTLAAADMQANELAKNSIVSLMSSNIRAVVETELSNNQISKEEAASWTKTVSAVTNKVAKKFNLNTLFLNYIGSFEPSLFIFKSKYGNVTHFLMKVFLYPFVS